MICKIIGSLLFLEATLMTVCLAIAVYFAEDDIFSFIISVFVTLIGGNIFHFFGRNNDNTLSRRDAYLVVSSSWVIFSLFGTLPLMIGGYINNFTDAYFEMMSGFTTTGATILNDVERLPHGILFWRTLTQWIGGLGIVFFTIALLPSMVGGSVRVFAAEATGPVRSRLHPHLSTTAKWIWTIYLALTIGCAACYIACGMGWFDGVNYAMTTTATGGFSTHNSMSDFLFTPTLEYICTIFCFLAGINFTLLYVTLVKFRVKEIFRNDEFKFYLLLILGSTALIMGILIWKSDYSIEHAFRSGIFQVVSAVTSTGLFNDHTSAWPHVTWAILIVLMFIGGCSGSTSAGFKSIRALMLLKIIRNEFQQILHPNAVLPLKINGTNIPNQKRVTLLGFLTVSLLLCLMMTIILIASGVDLANAITITVSCIANVGPSLDGIGVPLQWSELPEYIKWLCSMMMLIGRLEIFSVLVIFTPAFWKKR